MEKIRYCASAYVLNKELKVLLIKHKKFNKYIQPGGHIEEGETPKDTAIREVYEETNIVAKILSDEPFSVGEYHNNVGYQIDYQFIGFANNDEIVNNGESFNAGWFSLEQIKDLDVVDDLEEKVREVLKIVKEGNNLWNKELLLQKK